MIVQDNRTDEQKRTHRVLVVGTDRFLSGWGQAEGGTSVAAWACTGETWRQVEQEIRARGDMQRVRVVVEGSRPYRPRGNVKHFHVYVR